MCRAHVGDDGDASIGAGRQHSLHARLEQGVIAGVRVGRSGLLRQGDRSLGKTLEDEVVQIAPGGELHGRFDPIAREPRAAANANRLHSAKTPNSTAAIVIRTDARNSHGAVKR